jgi:hypothetical protein
MLLQKAEVINQEGVRDNSLDVERVALLVLDDVVILLGPVLDNQVHLVLQRQEEQNGFFPRHSFHVHVVHLFPGRGDGFENKTV